MSRLAAEQNQAADRDVDSKPKEGHQKQNRREDRKLHRLFDEHGHQDNANGCGNADCHRQINEKGGQGQQQHADQNDKAERHDDVIRAQQSLQGYDDWVLRRGDGVCGHG